MTIVTMNAQNRKATDNYLDIGAGIGIFPTFPKDAGKLKSPPLSLNLDYKLARHFSLGAFIGHSVTESGLQPLLGGGTVKWENKYTLWGIRLAARSLYLAPWDVYGGFSLGYSHSNIEMMEGPLDKAKEEKGVRERSGKAAWRIAPE